VPFPGNNQPNLDGEITPPSGQPGGGGGSPSNNPSIDLSQLTVTGGLSGTVGAVLVFGSSDFYSQPVGWVFDSEDFNSEEEAEYHFKVEEVEVYTQPTIVKVILRYRDLGKATLTGYFAGNVLQNSVASKMVTIVFGGKADKKIYTTTFDLTCTFEAPQFILTRQPFSGAFSITKVLIEIERGDVKLP